MKYFIPALLIGLSACAAEVTDVKDVESEPTAETQPVQTPAIPAKELRALREGEKMARCKIEPGGYDGPCVFLAEPGGTFIVSRRDQSDLIDDISMITVAVIGEGKADVRGLASGGRNSRWGEATRSEDDRACWVGKDFSVCAY